MGRHEGSTVSRVAKPDQEKLLINWEKVLLNKLLISCGDLVTDEKVRHNMIQQDSWAYKNLLTISHLYTYFRINSAAASTPRAKPACSPTSCWVEVDLDVRLSLSVWRQKQQKMY